jgi:hypothetical protein
MLAYYRLKFFLNYVTCRFTGNVKLKGLIIMGGDEGTHPSVVRL